MSEIKFTDEDSDAVTIELRGLTAIRIDTVNRIIAIDNISGSEASGQEWTLADLRGGRYGDFHRLRPAGDCFDADCASSGEHVAVGESSEES